MRRFIDIVRESVEAHGDLSIPVYPSEPWSHILSEDLNEYQTIPDVEFDKLDFSEGSYVGNIKTGLGPLKVFQLQFGREVLFGAGREPGEAVAELTIEYLGNGIGIMRTVSTDETARGQGVASELALFVHAILGITILNDTQLSKSGEALRNSLIRSGHFDVKIYDVKTSTYHEQTEVGQQAADGTTILAPRDDDQSEDMWSPGHTDGQRFFWALKAKDKLSVVREGETYTFGISRLHHRPGNSRPPKYFQDDAE